MPTSVKIDPFSNQPVRAADLALRTPQARVLAALMPDDPTLPVREWRVVNRAQLSIRAGYNAPGGKCISGTVTRALNGIRAGSSSGDPHPGLLARGMVETLVLDLDNVEEVNYRITPLGVRAYQAYVAQHGTLPVVKDAALCVNDRYKGDAPTT